MGANVSSISVVHSCHREKRDITPILGGSPKTVSKLHYFFVSNDY